MKKLFLLVSMTLLALSLTAFGFINWRNNNGSENEIVCRQQQNLSNNILYPSKIEPNPDFSYGIGPRFNANLSLEKLRSAKTIVDLLPKEATEELSSFQNVRISVYSEAGEVFEKSGNEMLSEAQMDLLRNCTYGTDFSVHADSKKTDLYSRNQKDYKLVYYISIVPETQAKYKEGKETLVKYLKDNSLYETAELDKSEINSGMLHFVVSADGAIKNIRISSSCGHEAVDKKMEQLILSSTGNWIPAQNSKSENIDQELVFFYGMIGC